MGAGFQQSMRQAEDQFKKIVDTSVTPYLWVSIALYVLISGCAFVASKEQTPPPATGKIAFTADKAAAPRRTAQRY